MSIRTIDQVDVAGKRVLMRVDFNVPLDSSHKVTDDRRIREAIPSIKSVVDRGGRLILMSHLGRPGGTGHEPAFSLRPAAERLSELLGREVLFPSNDCIDDAARAAVENLGDGEVVLLENLRFHDGERTGDAGFAAKLAANGDIYCNEAFGTSHRADASMVAVPEQMKDAARVAGLLLRKELDVIGKLLEASDKPFVAVLGGAKVSDKLGAIRNLMDKVDTILVGGGMAYTFLKALGKNVGSSLVERTMLSEAKSIIDMAAASPADLILPTDHICAREIARMAPTETVKDGIPDGMKGLDIGPDTREQFGGILRKARTIIWNGPVGVFETPPFDVGTKQIARSIARAGERGATTVIGGGDTAAAVHAFDLNEAFTHVSTGGGASIAMLEGKALPGVVALE